jgi:hypothetical protein
MFSLFKVGRGFCYPSFQYAFISQNHTSPPDSDNLPLSATCEPILDEQSNSQVEMTGLLDDSQIVSYKMKDTC